MSTKTHPSLGDPGDVVEYHPLNPFLPSEAEVSSSPIRVRVPPVEIPTIFAHRQWRAGMLLADFIYAGILPLEGCNVLELGAGTGLPSIAAHQYGKAKNVVATDFDSPLLIATLTHNVRANCTSKPSHGIKAAGHTWAKSIDDIQDLVAEGTFDVILLADCIWDDLSHEALLKSVTTLLRQRGRSRVYMASGLHTGRDRITAFLRRARRGGLRLVSFPSLTTEDSQLLRTLEDIEVQGAQLQVYASDEALSEAAQLIAEVQILSNEEQGVGTPSSIMTDGIRVWPAKTPRLSDTCRTFVVEEREEEKKKGGVHLRNKWMTFFALAWQEC